MSYTLYHHPVSICSIMVRYTYALRGPAKEGSPDLPVHDQVVDIFNQEQLSERFLCDINAKGQVSLDILCNTPPTYISHVPCLWTSLRSLCWQQTLQTPSQLGSPTAWKSPGFSASDSRTWLLNYTNPEFCIFWEGCTLLTTSR